ncbi:TPA: helix-turn-helix domain-containing protein [Vibrio cholerae]|nr:helix-turn-helix domain-containing protein [Vibrio cholerae]HDL9513639.1 helix-turn-helix domain-containing protein [Vibrio cholerae]
MSTIEVIRSEFSKRLIEACERAGLESHGRGVFIAKNIGITPKAVSRWFNGETIPSHDKLIEIADLLSVSASWLQFGQTDEPQQIETTGFNIKGWTDLVKVRMKDVGLTQDSLAEKMNVAQSTIARYLNEVREPDIRDVCKILNLVGLDLRIVPIRANANAISDQEFHWSDLIRLKMKENGITQACLAEKVGMSQSAVAHWLGGRRSPSIEEISLMMKTVGLDRVALKSNGMVESTDTIFNFDAKLEWTDLAKQLLLKLEMSQETLAEMINVTPGCVGHWLNGRRDPSMAQIASIFSCLGLNSVTLYSDGMVGCEENSNQPNANARSKGKSFPVLTASQAATFVSQDYSKGQNLSERWCLATEDVPNNSFWLEVEGDSMASLSGQSIPDGALALIDRNRSYKNKSLVVAKLHNSNELTVKQIIIDAGQRYLRPLNQNYKTIPIDENCLIVGVVADVKIIL